MRAGYNETFLNICREFDNNSVYRVYSNINRLRSGLKSDILPNRSQTILLVDDDFSIRQFLSIQLEQEGFEVSQAEDGIDAIVKLRNCLPRVIISDLQMPRMPGLEFITVMRQRFPYIPVIVLAGAIPKDLVAEIKPDRCGRACIG